MGLSCSSHAHLNYTDLYAGFAESKAYNTTQENRRIFYKAEQQRRAYYRFKMDSLRADTNHTNLSTIGMQIPNSYWQASWRMGGLFYRPFLFAQRPFGWFRDFTPWDYGQTTDPFFSPYWRSRPWDLPPVEFYNSSFFTPLNFSPFFFGRISPFWNRFRNPWFWGGWSYWNTWDPWFNGGISPFSGGFSPWGFWDPWFAGGLYPWGGVFWNRPFLGPLPWLNVVPGSFRSRRGKPQQFNFEFSAQPPVQINPSSVTPRYKYDDVTEYKQGRRYKPQSSSSSSRQPVRYKTRTRRRNY